MLFEFCKEHAFSQNTYETRTAVVLMMRYLLTDDFGEDVISILENIDCTEYYVGMAVAWALSESFIKFRERTLEVSFSIVSFFVLLLAICVKLWMAYFNNKLYKLTNNINLKAVCQDSLNDCIATSATIISLVISHFTGFYRIDGIVGIFVAVAIIMSGVGILKDVMGPLLGQPPSASLLRLKGKKTEPISHASK